MSFKPIYAHEIIDGMKDCEVRTYFGDVGEGDRVIVYSSSPEKSFLGEFTIRDVYVGDYVNVCSYVKARCELFEEVNWDFIRRKYSSSKRRLIVIGISNVERYSKPVTLSEIRSYIPYFKPPMSYIVIPKEVVKLIRINASL